VLDTIMEFIQGALPKDWGAPTLAALIALFGVVYTQRSRGRQDREHHAAEEAERLKTVDRTYDIAATQDLTARFKALMDGYEARIIDLSNELKTIKLELREAREETTKLRERLDAG